MLLTIDIGNTSIHAGIFDDNKLIANFRSNTLKICTENNYKKFFNDLAVHTITGIIISSVVPELDEIFMSLCKKTFSIIPILVSTKLNTNLILDCEELGGDRLANNVAAYTYTQSTCIIVDCGTAITFDAIGRDGTFLGGAIAPGILLSYYALMQQAAKLDPIELTSPQHAIEKGTTENLQSGVVFGFTSLIDGMISRMKNELKDDPKIFLTGGQAEIIATTLQAKHMYNKYLTLEGLQIIWEMNSKSKN